LNFPAWKLYHETAAGSLPESTWHQVSDAYALMYPLRTSDDFSDDLSDVARSRIREAHEAAAAAVEGVTYYLKRPS